MVKDLHSIHFWRLQWRLRVHSPGEGLLQALAGTEFAASQRSAELVRLSAQVRSAVQHPVQIKAHAPFQFVIEA